MPMIQIEQDGPQVIERVRKLGVSHMNHALPKKLWGRPGLVSILDTINRLNRIT
ncbi:Retron-type RNA-directed DNA polymerase [Pseudomonas synxantha]|uniref:Retron-type RNA-directed DNA polymerase n=1 Tax=Pseudomonas synxantha TaxID=47883 RepID=A0A3G7U8L0_9PSED|nr:Retron-type RNA-directed DNA polymerase [Pseudomonas synxantha]